MKYRNTSNLEINLFELHFFDFEIYPNVVSLKSLHDKN